VVYAGSLWASLLYPFVGEPSSPSTYYQE
jgi:hypothetical protein